MPAQPHLTPQREAVLAVIQEAEKHLTAQEIYDRVRQRLPNIAYATVYNALAQLQQAGLIQAVHIGGGATRYDQNIARHDHLICCECGKILDYSFPDIERAAEQVSRTTGFHIQKAEVMFTGVCPDCQFKRNAMFNNSHHERSKHDE